MRSTQYVLREREVTQSTKRQDTQPTETLAGKIKIQNRANEPMKSTCRKFAGNTWRRDKVEPRPKTLKVGMIRYDWVLGGKTTKIQWNAQARNPCNDKIEALLQVRSKP